MPFDINVTFHADDQLLAALNQAVPYLQMLTQKASTTLASAPSIPESEKETPTASTVSAIPAPAIVTPAASVAPQTPGVPVVPTTPAPVTAAPTPGYTLEQLSKAGAELASDPIKRNQLIVLLYQFGVQAITMLPPEQYGAFATALRGLGAAI